MKNKLNDYIASLDMITLGKGSKMLAKGGIKITETHPEEFILLMRVQSESNPLLQYKIQINYGPEVRTDKLADCNCLEHQRNRKCKHTAAAVLFLLRQPDLTQLKVAAEESVILAGTYQPLGVANESSAITYPLNVLVPENINRIRSYVSLWDFNLLLQDTSYEVSALSERRLEFRFRLSYGAKPGCVVKVEAAFDKTITAHPGTCGQKLPCLHQRAAMAILTKQDNGLLQLISNRKKTEDYFKNRLKIPKTMPLTDFAQLVITKNKVGIHIIDETLQLSSEESWSQIRPDEKVQKYEKIQSALVTVDTRPQLLFIWQEKEDEWQQLNFLQLVATVSKMKKDGNFSRKHTPLAQYYQAGNPPLPCTESQTNLLNQLDKVFSEERFSYYEEAEKNFYGIPESTFHQLKNRNLSFYLEAIRKDLMECYPMLLQERNYIAERNGFSPMQLQTTQLAMVLTVTSDEYFVHVELEFESEGTPALGAEVFTPFFIRYQQQLYPVQGGMNNLIYIFGKRRKLKWFLSEWKDVYENLLLPYLNRLSIRMKTDLLLPYVEETEVKGPIIKVYLKEQNQYFLVVPTFEYEHAQGKSEMPFDGAKRIRFEKKKTTYLIPRDSMAEEEAITFIRALHPAFAEQHYQNYFYLPEQDVMEKGWLLHTIKKLQEQGITVMGMKQLKKHHYNLHSPRISMSAGTGIDWFDLQVKVSFGDQELKLSDFRNAIINKQTFVRLGDGSMGILPEEWLEKYQSLFAASVVKKDQLQINRFQATLIDSLYDEIDNNQALYELQDKLKRLYQFEGLKTYRQPTQIKAELRNYQQTGFEWLCFLDDYGWGGCLADDMGLGKTLQMLTFLQYKINKSEKFTALVVVPTSLIFNWENEINKFTTSMKYLLHTGLLRKREVEHFSDYHIILTTYGLLRRDIEMMQDFVFDYVILDESQAIKNPMAQISKCVKLLKAHNRLVMTGTPVENSTFDLYSQFDFLNPGMLGSLEQFRYQYANLIDSATDEAATAKLRKQLYPFILSRKKNEVAKELPEKTETVIYCEMEESQQAIYNAYRMRIRQELSSVIEEKGVAKSSLMILQAFTKLRQICNSPALLKEEQAEYENVGGVKLRILLENVEELIQENHKVLLFSFFTSMLKLIEDKLIQKQIPYVKITGETTNRKEKVEVFQQDEQVKVFLISLKAGGTGLNLTAADYVYLIDPWWNPAVEQQAIDRTHRIGQDKQIFAYKLICKGTIEEKILQLQQKKKNLVTDLIQIEKGGLKTLTKEDVLDILG